MSAIANIHNEFVIVDCDDSASYSVQIECPLATWDELHIMPLRASFADIGGNPNNIHFYATSSLVNDNVIGYFRGDSAYQANYPVIFKNQRNLGSFRQDFTINILKFSNNAITAGQATGQLAFYARFIKYAPTNESKHEEQMPYHRHV